MAKAKWRNSGFPGYDPALDPEIATLSSGEKKGGSMKLTAQELHDRDRGRRDSSTTPEESGNTGTVVAEETADTSEEKKGLETPDFLLLSELKTSVEENRRETETLRASVADLSRTFEELTDVVKRLVNAPAPAPTTDLTPVLAVLGDLQKKVSTPVDPAPAPDLSGLEGKLASIASAVEKLDGKLSKLPSSGVTGTAPAVTLEETIDRNLAVEGFMDEVRRSSYRRGFDLNGVFKTPEEVKAFFGEGDPKTHGLKPAIARFESQKFVGWSDERHLRVFERMVAETPSKSASPKSQKKPSPAKPAPDTLTATQNP